MRKCRILCALAALFLVASCGEKENGVYDDSAAIVPRSTSLSPDGGSIFVSVTALAGWTVTLEFPDAEEWATMDPASGTGSRTDVRLRYDANSSSSERDVILVLKPSKGAAARATVTQKGVASQDDGPGDPGQRGYGYDVAPSALDWLELPATVAGDGRELLIHNMDGEKYRSVERDGTRNWSCYWDYANFVSIWVAYPLNASLIGASTTRSEAWGYDPVFGSNYSVQQNVSKGYLEGNNGWYSRGHQIPSADRLGTFSRNATTFYGTNMTPQDNAFNGGVWASLESKVRGYSYSCDTLYVVSGCIIEGSQYYALDRSYNKLTVPTHYFKALLAHTTGGTQGQDGYLSAGFLLPHASGISNNSYLNYICSIDELEAKTGIDFFPNLSKAIGAEKAAKVESEAPSLWWK